MPHPREEPKYQGERQCYSGPSQRGRPWKAEVEDESYRCQAGNKTGKGDRQTAQSGRYPVARDS